MPVGLVLWNQAITWLMSDCPFLFSYCQYLKNTVMCGDLQFLKETQANMLTCVGHCLCEAEHLTTQGFSKDLLSSRSGRFLDDWHDSHAQNVEAFSVLVPGHFRTWKMHKSAWNSPSDHLPWAAYSVWGCRIDRWMDGWLYSSLQLLLVGEVFRRAVYFKVNGLVWKLHMLAQIIPGTFCGSWY